MNKLSHEICLELKEAGFPQKEGDWYTSDGQWIPEEEREYIPSSEELVAWCGKDLRSIDKFVENGKIRWVVTSWSSLYHNGEGETMSEAVAKLGIEIHVK